MRLFSICLLFLLLFSTTAQAEEKNEEDIPFDLRRTVLMNRLKNVLVGNDLNTIRRSLIDRRFSPLHGMAAYRELLLWGVKTADDNSDAAYWADIVSLVREGMIAVVRDSSMGVPLESWSGEGNPVSIVYLNSFPAYAEVPDFNDLDSLKWRPGQYEEVVTPGSIGISLTAKSLLINTDQSPAGKKQAPLMLASLLQEFNILTQQLFLKKRWVSAAEEDLAVGGVKKIQGKESERGVKMLLASPPKELSALQAQKN